MINYLRHMAVFAAVVDEGSFRATAKVLNLAPSRVSQTISDLEVYLGVTLFYRTTRKLQLTNEGKKLYLHAAEITKHAESGINELNALSLKPAGELKVSLPAFLTASPIATSIAEFARQHPEVYLSLIYSDHIMDPISDGIDVSVRVGWLKDSSMLSRKLSDGKRLLVAGKGYVAQRSVPKHPSDLKEWDWISFSMRPSTVELTSDAGEVVSIHENSRMSVNSAGALKHLACQNLGLTILPEHIVEEPIKAGELVHVLPQWKLKPLGYYAVWLDKSRRDSLALLFVRFLSDMDDLKNKLIPSKP